MTNLQWVFSQLSLELESPNSADLDPSFQPPVHCAGCSGVYVLRVRVQLIGHFKTCMTEIYIPILCAHGRLYPHAPARLAPRAVIALDLLFASLLGACVTLRQAGRGLLAHKTFARSLAPELTLGYLIWPCRHLFELLHDLVVRVKTLVLACWVECGVVPNFGLFAQAALH